MFRLSRVSSSLCSTSRVSTSSPGAAAPVPERDRYGERAQGQRSTRDQQEERGSGHPRKLSPSSWTHHRQAQGRTPSCSTSDQVRTVSRHFHWINLEFRRVIEHKLFLLSIFLVSANIWSKIFNFCMLWSSWRSNMIGNKEIYHIYENLIR